MAWNWQLLDWRKFSYNTENLHTYEEDFIRRSSEALGALKHIEKEGKSQLYIEIIREEALQTSQIEGEFLDRDSVQSSLRRHFGLQTESPNKLRREQSISDLLIDVYENYSEPLSHELLKRWHNKLFSEQRTDAGEYRTLADPMQVVSGAIHNPKVHFEAPPSAQVSEELDSLIHWYNEQHEQKSISPLIITAITHLWFESIHPFGDGNGRIGRALAEKSLSQSLQRPALISLSTAIEKKKKAYYDAFSLVQSGTDNEITSWLEYFLPLIIDAQNLSLETIDFVIKKGRLLGKYQNQMNERQFKVVMRILQEGVHGFIGGLSAGNYKSITQAPSTTATRDLNDLLKKGILTKTGEKKHTRYYLALD